MPMIKSQLNGPIPGENFTSDTKNYPWHRPPDFDDLNDALEHSFKHLSKDRSAFGLLTMLDNGMTIVQATTAFVISGVGSGKWTPDYAMLMAGPIARFIEMMAESYNVKAELGLDPVNARFMTNAYFRAQQEDAEDFSVTEEDIEATEPELAPDVVAQPTTKGFGTRQAPQEGMI